MLTISSNDLVADVAQVSEQLVVMLLAVRQPLLLVMSVPMEWLLTFGAHKMLKVVTLYELIFFNRLLNVFL